MAIDESELVRGESLKVVVDYDLFDVNVKGCVGTFLKKDESTGKFLVHFAINGEWAELLEGDVERLNPGIVTAESQEFVDRIREMTVTY